MDDKEFDALAAAALARIETGLDAADADFEQPGAGILEVDDGHGGKLIVNRHNVAREIWIAAKSGGFHFRYDGQHWRDTRDGSELFGKLAALLAAQAELDVSF